MRLFFALPLPEELKMRLAEFQRRAKALGLTASWPDPQGLHLTLAFLGETEEVRIPSLLEVARHRAASHAPIALQTAGLGGFPSDRRARILWLGLEDEPRLAGLCADLRQGLKGAGQAFDEKPFRPHLTLARFQAATEIRSLGEGPGSFRFEVRELVLFQSVATLGGARYRGIGAASLG